MEMGEWGGSAGTGRCQAGRLPSNGGQRVTCAAASGPAVPAHPNLIKKSPFYALIKHL